MAPITNVYVKQHFPFFFFLSFFLVNVLPIIVIVIILIKKRHDNNNNNNSDDDDDGVPIGFRNRTTMSPGHCRTEKINKPEGGPLCVVRQPVSEMDGGWPYIRLQTGTAQHTHKQIASLCIFDRLRKELKRKRKRWASSSSSSTFTCNWS